MDFKQRTSIINNSNYDNYCYGKTLILEHFGKPFGKCVSHFCVFVLHYFNKGMIKVLQCIDTSEVFGFGLVCSRLSTVR